MRGKRHDTERLDVTLSRVLNTAAYLIILKYLQHVEPPKLEKLTLYKNPAIKPVPYPKRLYMQQREP